MKPLERNACLARGELDSTGVFPALDELRRAEFVFEVDFGLDELPTEPGIMLVRGARQYGKSTWLEAELRRTIEQFGAATAYHINGDTIQDGLEVHGWEMGGVLIRTSPINTDTDGDGLADNVDPDPGNLPTATPTATTQPTDTPTPTTEATSTPTSTSEATATPTATPVPTHTPTQSATPTPS